MSGKVWDGIIYPFSNFNGATVEVLEWINNCIPHYIMDVITYSRWWKAWGGDRVTNLALPLNNWGIFSTFNFFFNVFHHRCNILSWNWSNTRNVVSALWVLMAWGFSTRASVARVLSTHPWKLFNKGIKTTLIYIALCYIKIITWIHAHGGTDKPMYAVYALIVMA